MKKLLFILGLVGVLLISCEEVFFVDDISEETIILLSPNNNAQFETSLVSFKWNAIDGAEQYNLQIVSPTFSSSNQFVKDTTLTTTSFEIELPPNKYQWRIKGINSGYQTAYSVSDFELITLNPLSVIELISPINNFITNNTEQELKWNPIEYAKKYRLQVWKPNASGELLQELEVQATDTIINFSEGSLIWQVKAVNNNINTDYSSRSILIDITKPITPELESPIDLSETLNNSVDFIWKREPLDGSSEFDSLFVYKDKELKFPVFKEKVVNKEFQTVLEPDNYFWFVKSYDQAGNQSESSILNSFIVLESIENDVLELTSPEDKLISNNATHLFQWNVIENASNYSIQVLDNGASNNIYFDITTEDVEKELTLQDGNYKWQVKAKNEFAETAYSERTILIDTQKPNTPELIAPINGHAQAEKTIAFEFNRELIAGSTEFDSLFVYKDETLKVPVFKQKVVTKTIQLTVEEAIAYYWYIKSYDIAGNQSNSSNINSIVVIKDIGDDDVELTTPENDIISNNSNQLLKWNSVENAISYSLQILKNNGNSNSLILDITTDKLEKEINLQDGSYTWKVKAINEVSETDYSERSILIDTQKPNTPELIVPINEHTQIEKIIHFQHHRTLLEGSVEIDSLFVYKDSNLTELAIKSVVNDNNHYHEFEAGTYYWYIQSYDQARNSSKKSQQNIFTIEVDFSEEIVEILNPENELITNQAQQTLEWAEVNGAIDYRLLFHSVDNDAIILNDFTVPTTKKTITFQDGYYTWKIRAQSTSQNTVYSSQNFLIDTTNPEKATLSSPADQVITNNTTVQFIWALGLNNTGSKESSTINVYKDTGLTNLLFSQKTSELSFFKDIVPGTYYWYIEVDDLAGNTSGKSVVFSFTVQ